MADAQPTSPALSGTEAAIAPHLEALRALGVVVMGLSATWFFLGWVSQSDGPSWRLDFTPLLALGAGFMLLSGNLRTASLLRWLSAFALTAGIVAMLFGVLLQPWGLTRFQWIQFRAALPLQLGILMCVAGIAVWVLRVTGSQAVQDARHAAGRPKRRLWIPVAVAAILVAASQLGIRLTLQGDSARRAETLVKERLGQDFEVAATHVFVQKSLSRASTMVQVQVLAWRGDEYQLIPVQWQEP